MLAEFFVHDGGDTQTWRLKGHARQVFWRWVASWGAMVRSPADLGYDASAYALPPLNVHQHTVETEHNPAHGLFAMEAQTLMERRDARRNSLVERVRACELLVKFEWSKTAASEIIGGRHGVEEGIRGSEEAEGSGRSGYRARRNSQSAKDKEARKTYMQEYYKNNPEKFPRRTPEKQAEHNAARRAKYAENQEFRDAMRAAAKEWQDANPHKRKSQRLKKYGMTHAEFSDMMTAQDGNARSAGIRT